MIVNDAVVNLIILPHLLSDARIKADYEKVIYFTKVCSERMIAVSCNVNFWLIYCYSGCFRN